ncbi:hypothetical protein WJ96_07365 [Burkholderia ubonensis]|uniref:Uncharacterized protein n=1 Tax=Burkholderia ubonensis TaxID=101571 RepID=A0AAW3MYQ4_9BURK|nr:hypothetical protein [Burkholderia ubonensis]KVP96980.1 hypothetical protein WJ97_14265 [Burkholderia ubonensis]KVP98331.1 hypothetical protein WJ96_07365 [Burkholderia ubonensis]KVZ93029.1 hypothetical protein WL25_19025 [Burkholderia ubonensis]
MEPVIVDYWKVQNTGYSAGASWFEAGGTATNPARFDSATDARQFLAGVRCGDKSVKWRLVHVRVETTRNKRVTTERFVNVGAARGSQKR